MPCELLSRRPGKVRLGRRRTRLRCGAVSQYDGPSPPHRPRGVPGLNVLKRLPRGHHRSSRECTDRTALVGLLAGENRGKWLVRVG
ncbi:MAG: hypothetical protein ABI781_15640 [Burkholderiales bacterium]